MKAKVRQPAVAGLFYPARAEALRRMVQSFLGQSESGAEGVAKGLIHLTRVIRIPGRWPVRLLFPSRIRTWFRCFRCVSRLLGAILLLCLVWYVASRIHHQMEPVRLITLGEPPEAFEPVDRLRVGTFNMAHARGTVTLGSNWTRSNEAEVKAHLDRIAGLIREQQLDLVVLNEVDFCSAWSHHLNEARYLAEKLSFPFVVEQPNISAAFPFYQFQFGNAVLSRYPLRRPEKLDFPPHRWFEDVIAGNMDGVMCELHAGENIVRVIGVHLDYRNDSGRMQSARMITDIAGRANSPVLVMGDFNTTLPGLPGSRSTRDEGNAMAVLQESGLFEFEFGPGRETPALTFPARNPRKAVDWILCSKPLTLDHYQVLPDLLSDHLMVTAEVLLEPAKAGRSAIMESR